MNNATKQAESITEKILSSEDHVKLSKQLQASLRPVSLVQQELFKLNGVTEKLKQISTLMPKVPVRLSIDLTAPFPSTPKSEVDLSQEIISQADGIKDATEFISSVTNQLEELIAGLEQQAKENQVRAEAAEKINKFALRIAKWALGVAIFAAVASWLSAVFTVLAYCKSF